MTTATEMRNSPQFSQSLPASAANFCIRRGNDPPIARWRRFFIQGNRHAAAAEAALRL
ncbi:hypothetical protein PSEUDO8AS_10053 [Pseudomonas sp. 8AS]|nr:hypothetical protein PSEUDO8AS_10053 [Pseudomonas sp. 8AS]